METHVSTNPNTVTSCIKYVQYLSRSLLIEMALIFVRKMFIFTQVQLSGPISPSVCATNFTLALLYTGAVAKLAH